MARLGWLPGISSPRVHGESFSGGPCGSISPRAWTIFGKGPIGSVHLDHVPRLEAIQPHPNVLRRHRESTFVSTHIRILYDTKSAFYITADPLMTAESATKYLAYERLDSGSDDSAWSDGSFENFGRGDTPAPRMRMPTLFRRALQRAWNHGSWPTVAPDLALIDIDRAPSGPSPAAVSCRPLPPTCSTGQGRAVHSFSNPPTGPRQRTLKVERSIRNLASDGTSVLLPAQYVLSIPETIPSTFWPRAAASKNTQTLLAHSAPLAVAVSSEITRHFRFVK